MHDTRFVNGLGPAETERLALLGEECAEVGKAIGKILRHGYPSRNPTVPDSASNREDLEREIGDLLWSIDLMAHCGDISMIRCRTDAGRHARKTRYLHHQNDEGIS
jgi:NTP pyrophosphatase (non-canonical NTP hydrolase)